MKMDPDDVRLNVTAESSNGNKKLQVRCTRIELLNDDDAFNVIRKRMNIHVILKVDFLKIFSYLYGTHV